MLRFIRESVPLGEEWTKCLLLPKYLPLIGESID